MAARRDAHSGRRTVKVMAGAVVLAAGALAWPSGPARADAIDGEWCSKDGRYMRIQGPEILTPGGTRMRGDYDRHGFSYVIPPSDPGAGTPVDMVLLDDYTLHVRVGDAPDVQVWERCSPKTS